MGLASRFRGELKLNESFQSARKVLAELIAVDKGVYFDLLPAVGALFSCIDEPVLDASFAVKLGAVGANVGLVGLIGADKAGQNVDERQFFLVDFIFLGQTLRGLENHIPKRQII